MGFASLLTLLSLALAATSLPHPLAQLEARDTSVRPFCPNGSYYNTRSSSCVSCPANTASCSWAFLATACSGKYVLVEGYCVPAPYCNKDYVYDQTQGRCVEAVATRVQTLIQVSKTTLVLVSPRPGSGLQAKERGGWSAGRTALATMWRLGPAS